jgi:hypothetical protein
MPTCKEMAAKSGESYADITAAAKELGHTLPRGRGKSFTANATQGKAIVALAKKKRAAREAKKGTAVKPAEKTAAPSEAT